MTINSDTNSYKVKSLPSDPNQDPIPPNLSFDEIPLSKKQRKKQCFSTRLTPPRNIKKQNNQEKKIPFPLPMASSWPTHDFRSQASSQGFYARITEGIRNITKQEEETKKNETTEVTSPLPLKDPRAQYFYACVTEGARTIRRQEELTKQAQAKLFQKPQPPKTSQAKPYPFSIPSIIISQENTQDQEISKGHPPNQYNEYHM